MPEPAPWKVLVAEDRAGISASLLRSRTDFEVAVAHRLQAVERMFRDRPDAPFQAVLLDLSLADIADPQGVDAYRRVRFLAPGIPIVVLAPAGAEDTPPALAEEGAAACLPRQSTTAEVLAWTLRQAILRSRVESRRYKDLFDSVPIGILLAAGRRVAMANPAALKHLGYAQEDLARLSVLDFFPASMRGSLESALDACVAGEAREAAFAASLVRRDGSHCAAQVFMKGALLNDAPALALYLAFSAEPAMREAAPAAAAAAAAAASAASAAEAVEGAPLPAPGAKMEALARLAGGIAHDFNNLFTAINGYSDHLLTLPGGGDPAMARGLKAIRKAGDAAAAMTRGLMAFSHPGTGDLRELKVDAAVDDVAPMLSSLLGGALELRIRASAGPAAARVEPGQIEQILLNLCANAKEAMPEGGPVALVTEVVESAEPEEFTHLVPRLPGPYVVLSLRDTGKGMTPNVVERLFEPYFSSKTGLKGSGYGLASVYGIVSHAGGGISVSSAPGRGSVFRIWLPRVDGVPRPGPGGREAARPAREAKPPAGAAASPAAAPAPAVPADEETAEVPGMGVEEPAAGRRPSVLVIEDEASLREMLHAVLERYGYEVHEAVSGEDAEDRIDDLDRLPDLLVSDVLLRDGLGTDMVARLRASRPGLRALFISGHGLDTLLDQGIRIAPEDFLEKPFTPSQLALKVRGALASAARRSP